MKNDELASQADGRHGLNRRHFLRRSAIALPFLSNLSGATELLGLDGGILGFYVEEGQGVFSNVRALELS